MSRFADRDIQSELVASNHEGIGESGSKSERGLHAFNAGNQHAEFIAAKSCQQSALGKCALKTLCNLAQELISHLMAERIIDSFESIKVEN